MCKNELGIITLLLQKTDLVLDENFDNAIEIIENFEELDMVICLANIIVDNGIVEHCILKAKECKTNLICIAKKEDFENLIQHRKEWFLSNSDEIKIVSQLGSKIEIVNLNTLEEILC